MITHRLQECLARTEGKAGSDEVRELTVRLGRLVEMWAMESGMPPRISEEMLGYTRKKSDQK